jgi:GMP synthase (glutamine-hydrolysing)
VKPFLLLQLRPVDAASDNEFDAFLKYGGLRKDQVHRIRMEKEGVPEIDLSNYAGIIEGGGPSNVSDPIEKKSLAQRRFEKELIPLYDKIFESDFPFFGACYGIGSLCNYVGGEVSRAKYSEAPGAVLVSLNEEGKKDPLLEALPTSFEAFVGHKEACQSLPPGSALLASSETCPMQMIRFKKNIYATQFHPELDFEGLKLRVNIYMNEGYFEPEKAHDLIEANSEKVITIPELILQRFVDRYKTV